MGILSRDVNDKGKEYEDLNEWIQVSWTRIDMGLHKKLVCGMLMCLIEPQGTKGGRHRSPVMSTIISRLYVFSVSHETVLKF